MIAIPRNPALNRAYPNDSDLLIYLAMHIFPIVFRMLLVSFFIEVHTRPSLNVFRGLICAADLAEWVLIQLDRAPFHRESVE